MRQIAFFSLLTLSLVSFTLAACSPPNNSVELLPEEEFEGPGVVTLARQITNNLMSVSVYNDRKSSGYYSFFGYAGDQTRVEIQDGKIYTIVAERDYYKGCLTPSQLQDFKAMLDEVQLCDYPGAYAEEEFPICSQVITAPWVTLRYPEGIESLGGTNDSCGQKIDFCDPERIKDFLSEVESNFSAANENCN